ncbi:MAG: TonB-dependent receptor [Porphyromonadaceae bacterium]|nr:MAG: TonB-dependent receptor [Porphyromonadaceae bacterium]
MKRINLKIIILLILILSGNSFVFAQNRVVTGKVTGSDTGETLPTATVAVKGTTRGVITDMNGNYQIEILPGDAILKFSFVGYDPQEVEIGNKTVINVTLQVKRSTLEEVVVIGYGTVRKSDLTGAVSSVKSKDLVKITSINPEQNLQGKVTGVQVTSTSGAPGATPVVRIRGVGTFNNSSPIYVVDGVILDNISFLNSGDIASMEVLKDASATAIYGSRGANGVIIVTTKTGTKGLDKPVFSFASEFGMQYLAKKIDLLNGKEFAIITNEIVSGTYNNVDAVPNTDWQDLVFHPAPMHNSQFSIAGATAKTEYYVSFGLFQQDGIIDKSSYKRYTIKINNAYKLTDQIKFGNNFTLAPYQQQNAPNVTYSVYRAQPLLNPYYADGSYGVVYNVGNPLADLEYYNNYASGVRGVGNIYGEFTFLDGFTLRSSYGVDAGFGKAKSFTPAFTVYNPDGTATQQQNILSDIHKGNSENMSWLWENTLNYTKTFGIHSINAVAGYTMQETNSESLGLSGENVIRNGSDFWYIGPPYVYDPSNNVNTIQSITNGVDPNQYYSMLSYLFRANYTLLDKYMFTVTFRRDGSSKFAKENRFSNFPSFAAGWNIGREKFMEKLPMFTTMKVRASWGIIGNEKISYFDRFARVQSDIVAVIGQPDIAIAAASYGKSGNPNLKWESTTQTDVGLEFGMIKNKLTGEFDFYNRITEDILVELSTPGHMGNGLGQKIRYNAGSVLNRGLELNLNWRDQVGEFTYGFGVLGSTIHNEVLSIGGASGVDSLLIGGYLGNGQAVTQSRVGLPIGAFFGYVTDGVFQTQEELDAYPHSSQAEVGDLRFVDTNGDGKLNSLDRAYLGSSIPKFVYGFNFELAYKGFEFSADFQGQVGNKIFNGKEVVRPDPYNFEQHVFNRWTGSGTSNTEPRSSFGGYNFSISDRFIQDGSFMRLRNVTLAYRVPESFAKKIKLNDLRIYLKGTNVYTLTKFTGYTPEIGSYDVLSNGIDNGTYPVTAVYSVGINLTF